MKNYMMNANNNRRNDLDFFDDAFGGFFKPLFYEEKHNVMKTDIKETENSYVLDVEVPGFEKKDISLRINGVPASPMQIVQAHTMCEHQSYMRDYVLNDKGDVKEVWFQNITI